MGDFLKRRRRAVAAALVVVAALALFVATRREPSKQQAARARPEPGGGQRTAVTAPEPEARAEEPPAEATTSEPRVPPRIESVEAVASQEIDPPGTALVPGGRTWIGTEAGALFQLVRETPTLAASFGPMVAETPRHAVELPSFHLMVTEVTNEQYEVYVRATGARPPFDWAEAAIQAARVRYLEEEGQRTKDAREAGRPLPERRSFDAGAWWRDNWRGQPWALPPGDEAKPVVFVDHADARGYARWAGLRLMTEREYQRAVRGDGQADYPWGDAWEDGRFAATSELPRVSDRYPVGSFPEGASAQGALDLAGNVWEWTASPYLAFAGFEPLELELQGADGAVVLDALPSFDPALRVAVGGSFQNGRFIARAAIRRGTEVEQRSNALGFRCAASTTPGRDRLAFELEGLGPPFGVAPSLEDSAGVDRWRAARPAARPAGYAVIEGYEWCAFAPASRAPVSGGALQTEDTAPRLAPVGALSSSLRVQGLAPGTRFLVLCRERGAVAGDEARALLGRLRAGADFDEDRPWLVLLELDGAVAALVPCVTAWSGVAQPLELELEDDALRLAFDAPLAPSLSLRVEASLALPRGTAAGAWRR